MFLRQNPLGIGYRLVRAHFGFIFYNGAISKFPAVYDLGSEFTLRLETRNDKETLQQVSLLWHWSGHETERALNPLKSQSETLIWKMWPCDFFHLRHEGNPSRDSLKHLFWLHSYLMNLSVSCDMQVATWGIAQFLFGYKNDCRNRTQRAHMEITEKLLISDNDHVRLGKPRVCCLFTLKRVFSCPFNCLWSWQEDNFHVHFQEFWGAKWK